MTRRLIRLPDVEPPVPVIHFRIRDYISVLLYRVLAPWFGKLGRRARIVWPLRIVGARYCYFERGSTLQYGAYVAVLTDLNPDPAFEVGAGTMIGNHAHIIVTRRVRIGERALIADRVFIADNRHEFADPATPVLDQGLRQLGDVEIGDGTWIGENVVISGCRIGRNCVVGANSVVADDVPDHCVVVGAPARIIRRLDAQSGCWRATDAAGAIVE